jgi:hypothetical protein
VSDKIGTFGQPERDLPLRVVVNSFRTSSEDHSTLFNDLGRVSVWEGALSSTEKRNTNPLLYQSWREGALSYSAAPASYLNFHSWAIMSNRSSP